MLASSSIRRAGLALAALLQLALAPPPEPWCIACQTEADPSGEHKLARQAEARPDGERMLARQAEARPDGERTLARQAEARPKGERRLVAVGDVHGNYDGLVAILRRAAVIDETNRWIGGSTTFVQTGDVTDRGLGVRPSLDLLIALERDARRSRGRVVSLLGNHEVMNILGETRDVNPAIYAEFADERSDVRREEGWTSYARVVEAQKNAGGGAPPPYGQTRDAWMAAHPRGYLEYREAFGPRGRYGAWLRRKDIALLVDRTIFMHAGPTVAATPGRLADLNTTARQEIARFDRFLRELVNRELALPSFTLREVIEAAANQIRIANEFVDAQRLDRDAPRPTLSLDKLREAEAIVDIGAWSLLAPEGPLWIRGYATWPETERDTVAAALKAYGATRLVMGHTPQPGGIAQRFGGLVYAIDTGMLAAVYKGVPAALEIAGDRVTAIYLTSQEALKPIGARLR